RREIDANEPRWRPDSEAHRDAEVINTCPATLCRTARLSRAVSRGGRGEVTGDMRWQITPSCRAGTGGVPAMRRLLPCPRTGGTCPPPRQWSGPLSAGRVDPRLL